MKLRPTSNNLLVRRATADETSRGGIIIPDNAKDKPHRGAVLAAGPGYHTERGAFVETQVKAGQVVLFGAGLGAAVQVDGEDLLMISEDAVLAVVEDS